MREEQAGKWAVIGAFVAIWFPGAMTFGYPGVMGPTWMETFGVGKGAVGLSLFFLLAAVGCFMFIAGKLQEKYGERAMVRTGSVVVGAGAVVSAYAGNITMVYGWALLNGIGVSLIYIPVLTIVQNWYPQKRGLVSGIVNLSFGISAAAMAPVFAHMLEVMPYRTMNLLVGFVALITGFFAAHFTEAPERVPILDGPGKQQGLKHPMNAAPPVAVREFTLGEALRTRAFWSIWFVWAFVGASCISMVTLSIPFGLFRGFSFTEAVWILMSFNLTSGLIRILAGYLSDIVGRRPLMAGTFLTAGAAFFCMPCVSTLFGICVLALFIGLALGTLFAISAPLVTDCFGLKHFGVIFGFLFTAYGFVASVLGPALSGALLERGVSFYGVFSYLGVLAAVSGVLISWVAPPKAAPVR